MGLPVGGLELSSSLPQPLCKERSGVSGPESLLSAWRIERAKQAAFLCSWRRGGAYCPRFPAGPWLLHPVTAAPKAASCSAGRADGAFHSADPEQPAWGCHPGQPLQARPGFGVGLCLASSLYFGKQHLKTSGLEISWLVFHFTSLLCVTLGKTWNSLL